MSRAWLMPLDPVYRAAVGAKNSAYAQGWLRAQRLRSPVISVGNLSVGGAGKTPLTIRLAELLISEGLAVDVLSRGYGRRSRLTERVDPEGKAERFGDEPLLIARRAGVPVFVGASRYEAGLLAEQGLSRNESPGDKVLPHVHLLDDGFQHRRLARDADIVVVHRSDFAARLLPSGRLREPLSALMRADFIVLREEDVDCEDVLRKLGIAAKLWWMRRSVVVPAQLAGRGLRTFAFCGIARPEEFFSPLRENGVELASTHAFGDHHRYSATDVDRLVKLGAQTKTEAFAITEKDAVKLDASLVQSLGTVAPVYVARLEVVLRDESAVVRELRAKLPPGK